jgi:hypothetical protein
MRGIPTSQFLPGMARAIVPAQRGPRRGHPLKKSISDPIPECPKPFQNGPTEVRKQPSPPFPPPSPPLSPPPSAQSAPRLPLRNPPPLGWRDFVEVWQGPWDGMGWGGRAGLGWAGLGAGGSRGGDPRRVPTKGGEMRRPRNRLGGLPPPLICPYSPHSPSSTPLPREGVGTTNVLRNESEGCFRCSCAVEEEVPYKAAGIRNQGFFGISNATHVTREGRNRAIMPQRKRKRIPPTRR